MNMCGLESSFESRDHYHINIFFSFCFQICLLKVNCFTEFCCFLPKVTMYQP